MFSLFCIPNSNWLKTAQQTDIVPVGLWSASMSELHSVCCLHENYTCVWAAVPLQVFLESFLRVRWTVRLSPAGSRKHIQAKMRNYFRIGNLIFHQWSFTYSFSRLFSCFVMVTHSVGDWGGSVTSVMRTHLVLRQAVGAGRELTLQRLCTLNTTKMLLNLCEHEYWVHGTGYWHKQVKAGRLANQQFIRFKDSKAAMECN